MAEDLDERVARLRERVAREAVAARAARRLSKEQRAAAAVVADEVAALMLTVAAGERVRPPIPPSAPTDL